MSKLDADFSRELAELRLEVNRLRDIEAINTVLAQYSRALDWLDSELLDLVFFDDAEVDYGFYQGNAKAFKPMVMDIERGSARRWHFTAQVSIQLAGDTADVESYNLSLTAEQIESRDGSALMQFAGYYHDRFERRHGRWGIARRKHLLVSGASISEIAMSGDMGSLNHIGRADTSHIDYWRP
jgi:hypothetical protein